MLKVYDPKVPLHEQVNKINGGQHTADLLGIPFTLGVVNFEPLTIKGKNYTIALKKQSAVGNEDGHAYIYDKLSFNVSNETGELVGDNISSYEIDAFMKNIHNKAFSETAKDAPKRVGLK